MSELKKCPLCGEVKYLKLATADDLEENDSSIDLSNIAVVCCYKKGGCGASSGYFRRKKEAIENWNRREPEEKIVARLEELAKEAYDLENFEAKFAYEMAISIVRNGGEEV